MVNCIQRLIFCENMHNVLPDLTIKFHVQPFYFTKMGMLIGCQGDFVRETPVVSEATSGGSVMY